MQELLRKMRKAPAVFDCTGIFQREITLSTRGGFPEHLALGEAMLSLQKHWKLLIRVLELIEQPAEFKELLERYEHAQSRWLSLWFEHNDYEYDDGREAQALKMALLWKYEEAKGGLALPSSQD